MAWRYAPVVNSHAALAAAATVVAVAFALSTLERWRSGAKRHERAWTISLLLFAAASAALWVGAAHGWNTASFKAFYLFGAIVNVPWLALGTVELLAGERVGRAATVSLTIVSAFAAGVVVDARTKVPVPRGGLPQGKELFGILPRVLAAVCSGGAALVIVGGALWSARRFWKRRHDRADRRLAGGNVLIALGTLVLSASGLFTARLGQLSGFAVTLLVGIVVLFAGFLVANSSARPIHVVEQRGRRAAEELIRRAA